MRWKRWQLKLIKVNLTGTCYKERLSVGHPYPERTFDIVIGGPPCQPFSVGGHQLGSGDSRNGFPIFLDAVKRLQPKLWMFENVREMLYSNKHYFLSLIKEFQALGYSVDYRLLNAADFGVPQNRERLFVVGYLGQFRFPKVLSQKTTAGEAIGDLIHEIEDEAKILTPSMDAYILKYEKASKCINPRDLYLDRPSRTLTCRNISAATGDMVRVRQKDGRRRRISVREAARLQSFPDWFSFQGTENQQFYQIGNAVPPLLALQLARAVRANLEGVEEPEGTSSLFSSQV